MEKFFLFILYLFCHVFDGVLVFNFYTTPDDYDYYTSNTENLFDFENLIKYYSREYCLSDIQVLRCEGIFHDSDEAYTIVTEGENNVNSLVCTNCSLWSIPRDLFISQNSISSLVLDDCNISIIRDDDFWGASSLRILSLAHNNIEHIPRGAFHHFKSIQRIDLSFNFIKQLNDSTFNGNISLRELILSDNKIKTIQKYTFRPLKNVGILNLNNNHLHHLDKDLFVKNEFISHLYLRNNKLKIIPGKSNFLLHLPRLTFLDLSGNTVENLSQKLFINPSMMFNLNVSSCNLKYVDDNFFANTTYLHFLDLHNNSLKEFNYAKALYKRPLRTIDIRKNQWNCTYLKDMLAFMVTQNVNFNAYPTERNISNIFSIGCTETKEPNLPDNSVIMQILIIYFVIILILILIIISIGFWIYRKSNQAFSPQHVSGQMEMAQVNI